MTKTDYAPCNAKFTTLDQIKNAGTSVPAHCFDSYIADVEIQILSSALNDYNDLVKNGYDGKFDVYQRYTKEQAPVSIAKYMAGAQKSGNFKCSIQQYQQCCSKCQNVWQCPNGCSSAKDCKGGDVTVTIDCPTEIPTIDTDYYKLQQEITFTLTNSDAFFSQISDQYGISKDWVSFGDYMVHLANCANAGTRVNECIKSESTYWHGYPNIDPAKLVIPNPKDVIGGAYDRTKTLLDSSIKARKYAPYDFTISRNSDIVDGLAMPSLLMSEAVANMKNVVETADKVIEQERKEAIADFLAAIFMIIPFVGEAAGALGGATMRSIILMAGELGNVGYTVYSLVENPSDALGTIFGFLLGGGVSRQPFRDAAAARRGFSGSDFDKLPPRVKTDLGSISSLRQACLK
jgi:hypothetical protein